MPFQELWPLSHKSTKVNSVRNIEKEDTQSNLEPLPFGLELFNFEKQSLTVPLGEQLIFTKLNDRKGIKLQHLYDIRQQSIVFILLLRVNFFQHVQQE